MTVKELIAALQIEPGTEDEEIGYEMFRESLDLLIGEDPDYGATITIPKPSWQ
ncbi:hypothetical protein LCGC14_2817700 [marine sediment metagenome]|uniref:Uncharacterized protein n=1 Tax=marine sediment metagenome TaxID=412755 RepID=A0A0F9ARE8_9ZZZZ